MNDPRDYNVELSSDDKSATGGDKPARARPYLSVHFACCGVYQRIYRDADGKAYRGRCPKCGTPVRFAVGEDGTSARSFVVR
jgi:hypothetical protein